MDKSICRGWCFSWIGERPWSIRFWELDWPARVCFPSCWKNKRGRVSPFSRPCESEGNLRSSWISIIYWGGEGGGGVGRRIRSSGSIEGKDPVRRSKKWVEESFQPWNITVSCSSSVYFWLGYFWEVLKECLIFDFETKLHPRSLNHFLHGDINVCLIFMLPANFTAQED